MEWLKIKDQYGNYVLKWIDNFIVIWLFIFNNMVKYSLIIPTYEEKENITLLISMIDGYLSKESIDYEIVVVDDNSPDGTADDVEKLIKHFGNEKIKLLRRPGLLGLGTAYIDGFKLTTGDNIFLMDADFSHHVRFILIIT